MKKDKNIKQATVFLMAFVLVVGLAGAGGLVYGDSAEDTSDITVTVEDTHVYVWNLDYTDSGGTTHNVVVDGDYQSGNVPDETDASDPSDHIEWFIELRVEHDDDGDQFNVRFEVWQDGTSGDAFDFFDEEWTEQTTTDNVLEVSTTVDFSADHSEEHFLRYGDWQIIAELDMGGTGTAEYTDAHNPIKHVKTFVEITEGVPNVSGSVAPGETIGTHNLEGNDVEFGEQPTITFSINSNWDIAMGETTLTGPEGSDPIDGTAEEGYSQESGNPVNGLTLDVYYQYDIPGGQQPGVYEAVGVTHTVSNTETA